MVTSFHAGYSGNHLARVSYIESFPAAADQDLMITLQTNSQPPEGTDKLGEAVNTLYEIVRKGEK